MSIRMSCPWRFVLIAGLLSSVIPLTAAVNLPPALANLDGDTVSFSESSGAVLLDSGGDATVADPDSADFNGGSVTVSVATNRVDSEDVLFIQNQGAAAGQIGVSGTNVNFGGVLIGTSMGGSGGADLVVACNGSSTPAAVEALVRAIAYTNRNGANPSLAARSVAISVDDGDGGSSSAVVFVNIGGVNDAPTLALPAMFATFAGDLMGFTGVTVADVDAGAGSLSLTVAATSGTWMSTSGAGVVVSGSGSSTLGLSGTAAALNAFLAATNVVFATPIGAMADIALAATLNDGGNTGTDPGLTGDGSSEEAMGSAVFVVGPLVALDDAYAAMEDTMLMGPSVLANDRDAAGDPLTAVLVTGPTNGSLTLNLDGTFQYLAATNFHGVDTFVYKANDGMTDSSPARVTLTVASVNDRPIVTDVIPDQPATYGAPFTFTFNAGLFVDPDGDPLTYAADNVPPGIALDGPTRTFSGTMQGSGIWRVVLWATDDQTPPLSVTNTFLIRVGKTPLLAQADDQTKVYGTNNPPLTISYTGFIGSDTAASLALPPTATTVASNTSPPGVYPITVSGGDDDRYTFVYSNGTLTILKTVLRAVAESKSRAADEPNPPLTVCYFGFVGRDTEAILDVPPTPGTTATANSPPGSYPITLTGGSDDFYDLVLVDGTLVIREPGVPRTSGTFQGLFAEPGQARNESSGSISVTTREGKAFSAALRIEGRRFPFSGTFDTIGRATNAILRSGNFPVLVELQIGVCDVLDRIGGRVTDFAWSSPIEADPTTTSATTNEAGHYGFVLLGAGRAEGPGPYGHGFGTLNVTKRGGLKLALQCADRINLAGGMAMVVGGRSPCYLPVPGGRGAVLGWLTFSNLPTTDVTGSLSWMRQADPKRVMPQGFEATRFAYATRYTAPARGARIIGLAEGTLRFEGGQLSSLVQIHTLLTTEHLFRSNGEKLPVRIRPQSGLFSGYVGPVSGPVALYRGRFLQKTNVGVGFFEGVFNGLESGRVEFVP